MMQISPENFTHVLLLLVFIEFFIMTKKNEFILLVSTHTAL